MTEPQELHPTASRSERLAALQTTLYDVLVVGAGINGAVTAAALAARGVRVALVDRGDVAGETSMQSSNLAWGGIKYLESWEFSLVRKLCLARNALMRAYPTAIREARFLATIPQGFRFPRWFVYLGAWLYWLMGACFTQKPRLVSRRALALEQPLVNLAHSVGGFEYSDAHIVDGDARFVLRFVLRAVEHGATVLNYAAALASKRSDGIWVTELQDVSPSGSADRITVKARVLVNACGPFADAFNQLCAIQTQHHHVLSKGVHLIVRRLTEGAGILAFFATDGRLFFVIPLGNRSCIGTTDTRTTELPPTVAEDDRAFILENANALLKLPKPLTHSDIISERCGVRPLARASTSDRPAASAEWTALSRKHVLEMDRERQQISIFGGKLTDCINVGEEITQAVASLGISLGPARAWYGEGTPAAAAAFLTTARAAGITEAVASRLWRCHGSRAQLIVSLLDETPALGAQLFPDCDVLRAEAIYAGRYELVETLEDFLRRRTQLAQVLPRDVWDAGSCVEDTRTLLFGARDSVTAR